MQKQQRPWQDNGGYAVVEAAILFPIMIMIFAALTLLAMYLPTRAALQRATQQAATALAIECGDTWLFFDEGSMSYYWENDIEKLANVYSALINSYSGSLTAAQAETIVMNAEKSGVLTPAGRLSVEYGVVNHFIYREIIVTATRVIPLPVNLSFVNFPRELQLTVTSTALAPQGGEFARQASLAADCASYINDEYETSMEELFSKLQEIISKIPSFPHI